MNTRTLTVALFLLVGVTAAQPQQQGGAEDMGIDLEPMLESLDPGRPLSYFELAEELAYEAQRDDERQVARELALMAWLLSDADPDAGLDLSRSAALLLADLATDGADRARFRQLAGITTPRERGSLSAADAVVLRAIGAVRRGEWALLRELRRSTDIVAQLRDAGVPGDDVALFESLLQRYADEPERSRTVRRQELGPNPGYRNVVNPENEGDPSPRLSPSQHELLLRVDAAILRAYAESLGESLVLTGNAPTRVWTLGDLAREYGLATDRVDLELTDGGWAWQSADAGP